MSPVLIACFTSSRDASQPVSILWRVNILWPPFPTLDTAFSRTLLTLWEVVRVEQRVCPGSGVMLHVLELKRRACPDSGVTSTNRGRSRFVAGTTAFDEEVWTPWPTTYTLPYAWLMQIADGRVVLVLSPKTWHHSVSASWHSSCHQFPIPCCIAHVMKLCYVNLWTTTNRKSTVHTCINWSLC